MKKSILLLIGLFVIFVSVANVNAKSVTTNSSLSSAIKLYKSGNYAQSSEAFQKIVKNDPSNAVAYYYLAMSSAQIGRKNDAIDNYEKVITLSNNRQLVKYATKGKKCLESPDKCNEPDSTEDETDRFIRSSFGSGFSDAVRSDYEKKKIENLMREINRKEQIKEDVSPAEFKEFRDFSSEVPTNDEIVAALRVLQKAGLSNGVLNYNSNISALNDYNNEVQLMNILSGNRASTMNPQVIQSLLSNQLTSGF